MVVAGGSLRGFDIGGAVTLRIELVAAVACFI
jgi:hypothetical protein